MEHVDELIAGHALHALDPAGEAELELHLQTCERCRRQLREMQAVTATLAYAAPPAQAPEALRDRLMAALDEQEPAPEAAPMIARPAPRPRRTGVRWRWLVSPALAVAVILLVVWNIALRGDVNDLHNQLQNGQTTTLPGVGTVVAGSNGSLTLYSRLAAPPAGKTYEAWVIAGGTPEPAGTFAGGRLQVTLSRSGASGDTVAITVEPAGGSAKPTTNPISAAKLSRA